MSLELKTVAIGGGSINLDFLRCYLEDAGIKVFFEDESIIKGTNLSSWRALNPTHLRVPVEDAERAMAIIKDVQKAEIIYDDDHPKS